MKQKNFILTILVALVAAVITLSCGGRTQAPQTDEEVAADSQLQVTSYKRADSTKYAHIGLEIELPQGSDAVSTAIRQKLLQVIDERLSHVTSFEEERFFPPFQGNSEDLDAMIDYYYDQSKAIVFNQSQADADERAKYITESTEMTEEEKTERLAEIPSWEYDFSLTKIGESADYVVFLSQDVFYMGGAHGGINGDGSLTFSKADGSFVDRMIEPSSVADIQPLLVEGLLSYFSTDDVKLTKEQLMEQLDIEGGQIPLPAYQPYPTEEGLVFVYQQYEIASYAAGMPSFVLPYAQAEPFLTAQGKAVCRQYLENSTESGKAEK